MSFIARGRALQTSGVQTRQARHALSGNAKSVLLLVVSIFAVSRSRGQLMQASANKKENQTYEHHQSHY
jgi:hypothetical protein